MFTLITLLVLALIAGATFTVKKVLNKRKGTKEEFERLKRVYTPEILKAFKDNANIQVVADNMPSALEVADIIANNEEPTLVIKHLKTKKIVKSKYKKRFTDYKLVIRYI